MNRRQIEEYQAMMVDRVRMEAYRRAIGAVCPGKVVCEVGVGLAPGRAFGPSGEGRLRLCFAAEAATLSTALDRLAPALG